MPAEQQVKLRAGDTVSVFWPEHRLWYDGTVHSVNGDGTVHSVNGDGTCVVVDADGKRDFPLNLFQDKCKYTVTVGGEPLELIDRVRASDGDVSKQLKEIGDVLRDISDRLPLA